MTDVDLKILPSELAKHRCVETSTFKLVGTKLATLKKQEIVIVFSEEFLLRLDKALGRSKPEIKSCVWRARLALANGGVTTIDQLISKKYPEIALLPGIGSRAMALVLDVLLLFGIMVEGAPGNDMEIARIEKQADELAKSLGVP